MGLGWKSTKVPNKYKVHAYPFSAGHVTTICPEDDSICSTKVLKREEVNLAELNRRVW